MAKNQTLEYADSRRKSNLILGGILFFIVAVLAASAYWLR
jgi:flagellar biosynthesis/type III secretory pathway M-ring protein FliF/YscJ